MDGMGQYSKNTLGHPHVLRRIFLHHQQLWTFEVYHWDTFFATPRPQHFSRCKTVVVRIPLKRRLPHQLCPISFFQVWQNGRPWLSDLSQSSLNPKFSQRWHQQKQHNNQLSFSNNKNTKVSVTFRKKKTYALFLAPKKVKEKPPSPIFFSLSQRHWPSSGGNDEMVWWSTSSFFFLSFPFFCFGLISVLNKTHVLFGSVCVLFKNKLKGRGRYIYSDLNLIIQGDFSKFLTWKNV